MVALGTAEGEVGHDLGDVQLADQGAVRVEAVQSVVRRGPHAPAAVEPEPVERSGVAVGEDVTPGERAVVVDVESPDVPAAAVADVELLLVTAEGEAVGPFEVVGDDVHLTRRVDAVHVACADLALRQMPLVVAVDAIAGIGEPDRPVGTLDDVVGAVEPPAVVVRRHDGDTAVVLGADDSAVPVLTRHHTSGPVEGSAVGVPGWLVEHTDRAGGLVPPQHPVVRDVAEQHVAAGRDVHRALEPATGREQHLQTGIAVHAGEAVVDQFEPRRHGARHVSGEVHRPTLRVDLHDLSRRPSRHRLRAARTLGRWTR